MTKNTPPGRRRLLLGACALACAGVATYATAGFLDRGSSEPVRGNGSVRREARDVGSFSGVAMGLAGRVDVRRGEREGVTVEADDKLLPLIETVVENGTLEIRAKRGTSIRMRDLKIVVQARELDHLALGGSGSIDADRVNGARVHFDIGGSGSIKVGTVEAERIEANLGGTGDLKAGGGNARKLSISIGGTGGVDFARVRTESASVTVAGAGRATVWARDRLDLTVAGSGDLDYYGDPKVSQTVMGRGNVRRLGAAPGETASR
jgi:hypothetical protein